MNNPYAKFESFDTLQQDPHYMLRYYESQSQTKVARDEGLRRGISLLSSMTVDVGALVASASSQATTITISQVKSKFFQGKKPSSTPTGSEALVEMLITAVPGMVAFEKVKELQQEFLGFLKKIAHKAIAKIEKAKWWIKAKSLAKGLFDDSIQVLTGFVIQVLEKAVGLHLLIPGWQQVKDAVKGIDNAIKAAETSADQVKIEDCLEAVGKGIPEEALKGFINYVETEKLLYMGGAAYKIGKSLAGVFIDIFTAGTLGAPFKLITAITEAVYAVVMSIVHAINFNKACKKCAEYVTLGLDTLDMDDFAGEFRGIIEGCPVVGAFFFAMQHEIGGWNLTACLQDFDRVVSSCSLSGAWAQKIEEAHKMACKYIAAMDFKPAPRDATNEDIKNLLEYIEQVANGPKPPPRTVLGWLAKKFHILNKFVNQK